MEIEEHLEHCYLRASSTNSVKESTSKADRSRVTFNITVILMRSVGFRRLKFSISDLTVQ